MQARDAAKHLNIGTEQFLTTNALDLRPASKDLKINNKAHIKPGKILFTFELKHLSQCTFNFMLGLGQTNKIDS